MKKVRSQRGSTLLFFVFLLPVAMMLFLMANRQVLQGETAITLDYRRAQTRLLAESALVVYQNSAGMEINGSIEGVGEYKYTPAADGFGNWMATGSIITPSHSITATFDTLTPDKTGPIRVFSSSTQFTSLNEKHQER